MAGLQRMDAPSERMAATRFIGLACVALFHLGLIYLLASGLGRQVVEIVQAPILASLIEETKPPPEQPPPPPPQLPPPPAAFVPLPEIQVKLPPPPKAIASVAHIPPPAPPRPAAPAAPREIIRVPANIDPAAQCGKPPYPAAARRLQEEGAVVLRFRVGVDGKVITGNVESSSGHERLDRAALDALSLCRFRPGTVDGVPEESWATVRYVWRLEKQAF